MLAVCRTPPSPTPQNPSRQADTPCDTGPHKAASAALQPRALTSIATALLLRLRAGSLVGGKGGGECGGQGRKGEGGGGGGAVP